MRALGCIERTDHDLDIVDRLAAGSAGDRRLGGWKRRHAIGQIAIIGAYPIRRPDVWAIPEQGLGRRIGDDHAALPVRHQHRVGHAGDGCGQNLRIVPLGVFRPPLLGDVVERRHPAAARHRLVVDPHHAAVGGLDHVRDGLSLRHRREQLHAEGRGVFPEGAHLLAARQQFQQRSSGRRELRRQVHHLAIALVAEHEPPIAVVHAQSLRHVVEGRLQLEFLLAVQFSRPLALARVTVELLDHERDGAVGAAAIAIHLLIGRADELRQPVEIDIAGWLRRLRQLLVE